MRAVAVGAIARQQVDIFDWQVQLGIAGILQVQAIVRCAVDLKRLQAVIAADTVFDMDDQIARRQRRRFGQEVLGPPAFARPRQAVAEDVGLGNDRHAFGFETVVKRQDGALHRLGFRAFDAKTQRVAPRRRQAQLTHAVIVEHLP